MRTISTLLLLAVLSIGLNAQVLADFEAAMADTSWTQFANAGDAPENFVMAENPDKTGINASDSCILFTVLTNADPWVGAWSDAFNPIDITSEKYMLEMMVHKDVISRCGLKLEGDGVDPVEVLVANTGTGAWELVTFDFTAAIGNTYKRLVFFPDFPESRDGVGSNCYIDNIGFLGGGTLVGSLKEASFSVYPNPAAERLTVRYPDMNSVTITNVVGQRIRSMELQHSNFEVIEVSDLKSGVYFLTVETANKTVSTKFIKE